MELAQFTMRQILELEDQVITDQQTEDYLIKQINNLYYQLHLMYDGKCKREHDEVEGNDYYIAKDDEALVFKHRTSGFAPRLIEYKSIKLYK